MATIIICAFTGVIENIGFFYLPRFYSPHIYACLLYTSDAADERSSVDLGGRRIIKKKKTRQLCAQHVYKETHISNYPEI